MFKKILLPTIFCILGYGFWISPNFKEIAAGVAIFLFGMLALEEGFKAFTGGILERLLRRTTDKVWKSLSFGVVTTTLMQSSSLVSVITISFLSAGLLSLAAGIGIIFGANLGTTTGAWLIAGFGLKVNIAAYAMPMLVFGVILAFQNNKNLRGIGYVLTGLGFLFLGIHYMKEGFEAYRSTLDLKAFAVSGFTGLLLFTAIGVAATVIMQSSHATLVLIITALAASQITYENALALAIGANIGTTITAILGSLSSNVEGKRLAGAHLIFNAVTAIIAIAFIHQIASAVNTISSFVGIAADDYTLKLAVFHTIFNTIGIVVMVPFIQPLVRFLERVMTAREPSVAEPKYLSDAAIELPDVALEAVRKETLRLYDHAFDILALSLSLKPEEVRSETPFEDIVGQARAKHRGVLPIDIDEEYATNVKALYSRIVAFTSQAQAGMSPDQSEELFELRSAGRDILEAIKDAKHLHKNLAKYIVSSNEDIRQEYNRIRLQLAETLRTLDLVRHEQSEEPTALLSLDSIRWQMEENDSAVNGVLDTLIREHRIDGQMATSLMNDTTYAFDVSKNLVQMGTVLFASGDQGMKDAERELLLNSDDIDQIEAGEPNARPEAG